MARMYGKLGWYGQCGCCNANKDKHGVKGEEERRWRSEAAAEAAEESVSNG